MIVRECETVEQLARSAASFIIAMARESIQASGAFHLALSGGSTPRRVYEAMVKHREMSRQIIEGMHLYFGDERAVPAAHSESNAGLAKTHLIDTLKFPPENIHAPNGGASDLEAEALRYEEELKRLVPQNSHGQPVFDLIWLGMGEDGHTASLFPGTKGLEVSSRIFIANEVPQLDTWRLTLTFDAIRAARGVLVLLSGEKKADVLAEVFQAPHQPTYPIERLRDSGTIIVWMADKAATSRFTPEQRVEFITRCA